MDPKQQNAQAAKAENIVRTLTALGLQDTLAETSKHWISDPSPLRRVLYAHFERYNLTSPRTGPQRDDL